MDNLFKIGDKFYKPVAVVSGIILGLISLNVVGRSLFFMSGFEKKYSDLSGSGWFSFLYVIFWIAFVVLCLCGIYTALRWFMGYSQKNAAANTYSQNAQPQYNQAAQNVQPQQNNGGATVCSKCGASVPAGNPFCTNCGNKIN